MFTQGCGFVSSCLKDEGFHPRSLGSNDQNMFSLNAHVILQMSKKRKLLLKIKVNFFYFVKLETTREKMEKDYIVNTLENRIVLDTCKCLGHLLLCKVLWNLLFSRFPDTHPPFLWSTIMCVPDLKFIEINFPLRHV